MTRRATRSDDLTERLARPRRVLLFGLQLALLTLVATPSTADAAPAAGRAAGAAQTSQAAGDRQATTSPASEGTGIQELLGTASTGWPGNRASASISVYSNHAKRLEICDNSFEDRIGLAIVIDPSGTQAPITYRDPFQEGVCFVRTIGYPVRKWKWISVHHNGSVYEDWDAWKTFPLPRPDF